MVTEAARNLRLAYPPSSFIKQSLFVTLLRVNFHMTK